MRAIYKYPLKVLDEQEVMMPKGARILAVQTQREAPCLWAEVELGAELQLRIIEVFGTGHPIDERPRKYLGTFQLLNGDFLGHVFERA